MWQSQRKVCERFLQTFFYAWPTITVTEVGNWQGYKDTFRYVWILAKSTHVAIAGEGKGKILNIPTPRLFKGRMVVIAHSLSYSWSR